MLAIVKKKYFIAAKMFCVLPVLAEVTNLRTNGSKTCTCESCVVVGNPRLLQINFTVDVRKDFGRAAWMNRDTILRRTSAVFPRTRPSTSSSPAPAASTPACGAGPRRRRSPAGTTAARRDGIMGQLQGLVSSQAVETMDLNVHTVSYL